MDDNIENALNNIGRIAANICGKGKTQDGSLIYVITAKEDAQDKFPYLTLQNAVSAIRGYISELEAQNKEDPVIARLKSINDLRGDLYGLKRVAEDGIEFYDAGGD